MKDEHVADTAVVAEPGATTTVIELGPGEAQPAEQLEPGAQPGADTEAAAPESEEDEEARLQREAEEEQARLDVERRIRQEEYDLENDLRGLVPGHAIILEIATKINPHTCGRLDDEARNDFIRELRTQCAARKIEIIPLEVRDAVLEAVMVSISYVTDRWPIEIVEFVLAHSGMETIEEFLWQNPHLEMEIMPCICGEKGHPPTVISRNLLPKYHQLKDSVRAAKATRALIESILESSSSPQAPPPPPDSLIESLLSGIFGIGHGDKR